MKFDPRLRDDEISLAKRVQTSLLPRRFEVPPYRVAARMCPFNEVGGDFYDVLKTKDGCWLAVGDVSGHDLMTGIITVMAQSALAALADALPDASPAELLRPLNRVLVSNIRERLGTDEYLTCALLRCFDDGRVLGAGAHLDLLVRRAKDASIESHVVAGTWLGITDDMGDVPSKPFSLQLEPGDLIIAYTDGVVESRSPEGEFLGPDRLVELIVEHGARDVEEIANGIQQYVQAWGHDPADDVTVVAMRYQPE